VTRPGVALGLAAAVAAAPGCGDERPPLSTLCTQGERPIAQALRRAPGPVALPDGTRLSQCVANARGAGDLQSFGVVVTRLADRLADRADDDPGAAVRLGYLIGAAERGAAHSEGIHAELVHRLQVTARRLPAGAQTPLERGRRAGERDG
jgi:hypothetical protein